MSNAHVSTSKVIETPVDLSQNIIGQGEHAVFECKICGKTYENTHKCQFHETICEHRHSTDPEKLCWYCNNPSKPKYPTYICSRHGEYPDTDEEFSHGEWEENDIEYIEDINNEKEQREYCDSPSFNVDEMYLDYLSRRADKEEAEKFDSLRWELEQEEYASTHYWYCDKAGLRLRVRTEKPWYLNKSSRKLSR